jgi:cytochrome b561
MLALITLHILGVVKHRFFDRERDTDVLHRML